MTVREALCQLLTEHPGEVITCAMVCRRLGRDVSRTAVSKQAGNHGRGMCVGVVGSLGGYQSRVKP